MMGIIICSHPDCQTSAGCICAQLAIVRFTPATPPAKTYQDGLAEGLAAMERVLTEIDALRNKDIGTDAIDGIVFGIALDDAIRIITAEKDKLK